MAPHYKLTYFPVRGLAEPIRLTLHYSGQHFEDYRVPKDAFADLKPKTPYGQLPILDVDGQQLVQSGAILRFLARKANLIGKNEWETAKADEIWSFFYDSMRGHIRYTHLRGGKPDFPEDADTARDCIQDAVDFVLTGLFCLPERGSSYFLPLKEKLYRENFLPIATKALDVYSRFLREANSGYALRSGLSYADFVIAEHVQTIENLDPKLAATHPDLIAHKQNIHRLPQLAAYIASRPYSIG